ncbi:hypothetical protein RJ639_037461, partial [Escallonia herrerae]
EPQLKFDERLDDWDSKNHQIITWFRNTSILSVYQQFGCYNTAKEIWDLLAHRYTIADLAHQYQLHDSLHRMKQEPGQSINSFLSQMQGIWDQLELSEPSWTCLEDSAYFIVYRDHLRLIRNVDTAMSSVIRLLTALYALADYVKSAQGIILVLLYADDMIITGSDLDGISNLKQYLNHHFEMKDLVSTASDGYYLSQAKYASDLFSRAGLTDSKTASTPLEPNVRFTPLDGTPLRDPTLYRILVGSLVYLTVTRPDIAHAVHLVSQFLPAPPNRGLTGNHAIRKDDGTTPSSTLSRTWPELELPMSGSLHHLTLLLRKIDNVAPSHVSIGQR